MQKYVNLNPVRAGRTVLIGLGLVSALAAGGVQAEERIRFERNTDKPGAEQNYIQYNKHSYAFAWDALAELSGKAPAPDASRADLAALTLSYLDSLPKYGQRETASVKPPMPDWFLSGYSRFQPATVAKSRYINGVLDGSLPQETDLAALYTFWCLYDAEWFNVSRKPDYKAWLSAVALSFPPAWIDLRERGESDSALHQRLTVPLQTKDEPMREIDNWINAFTKLNNNRGNPDGEGGAFAKPKVRSGLVAELLNNAGMSADQRLSEQNAYRLDPPGGSGLSDREFFLAAALSVEFFQEIYEQNPRTKQPLWFRDYFVSAFEGS
jgi:hypothetical protein